MMPDKTPVPLLTPQHIAEALCQEVGASPPSKEGGGWLAPCPVHEDEESNPSLLIGSGDTQDVIVTCRAGCKSSQVIRALNERGLWPTRKTRERKKKRSLTAEYDYKDAHGRVVFTKLRFVKADGSKDFFCGVRDAAATNGFRKGLDKAQTASAPLYRLPDLLAAGDGGPVFIVEGEKDCDSLGAVGLVGVCNHDGAGKWHDRHSEAFAGLDVVILPDNDRAGRLHAETVQRALDGVAGSVKVLELPDLPEKGDVTDWLEAGGTREGLLELVEACEVFTPHWRDLLIRAEEDGPPLALEANGAIYMESHPDYAGAIGYDTFTRQVSALRDTPVLEEGELMDDAAKVRLGTQMQRDGLRGSVRCLTTALEAVALDHSYDSLTAAFDSLPEWDGVKRIDTWIQDICGIDTSDPDYVEYVSGVGRRTLIAGAARAYANPKNLVKHDTVLVLEGLQEMGKTSLCEILNLDGAWFGKLSGDVTHDNTKRLMLGCHVMEVAELTAVKKTDNNPLKDFFSSTFDEWIEKYKETSARVPRRCIFIGTHNPDGIGYLNDPTGGRRYLIVAIEGIVEVVKPDGRVIKCIDLDRLREVKVQLWAEAKAAYVAGEQWWAEPGDRMTELMQASRYKASTIADEIDQYLTHECKVWDDSNPRNIEVRWTPRDTPLTKFFPHNFWRDRYNEDYSKQGNNATTRDLANYMRHLGFERKKARNPEMDGRAMWGYVRQIDFRTVSANDPRIKGNLVPPPENGNKGMKIRGRSDVTRESENTPKPPENAAGEQDFGGGAEAESPSTQGLEPMFPLFPLNKKKTYGVEGSAPPVHTLPPRKKFLEKTGTGNKPDFAPFFDGVPAGVAVGLDIETTALRPRDGRIRSVQFWYGGESVFVDVDRLENGIEDLRDVLEGHSFVVFNAQFEYGWFDAIGIRCGGLEDAKLLYAAIYGGTISLQDASQRFLGEHIPKAQQTSDWGAEELTEEQVQYAVKDAEMARRLWEHLSDVADAEDVWDGYFRLLDAVPMVCQMEANGMPFDSEIHQAEVGRCEAIHESATQRLLELVPEIENWNSPAQIQEWLRQEAPRPVRRRWPKTTTKKLSVSVPVLKEVLQLDGMTDEIREILETYIERQSVAQLLKTFGDKLSGQVVDGRLYGGFQISGAVTGRMSSSKPNFQNMPRGEFRRILRAGPGRQMVVADYSQIEVRVGGMLAGDERVAEQFAAGHDIHRATAALMTGKDVEEVTDEERRIAKSVTFGQQYGMGDEALAKQLGCSVVESVGHREQWERQYAGIAAWRQASAETGKTEEALRTAGGRRIQLRPRPSPSVCYNYPVQGSAADVMYAALARLNEALKDVDLIYPLAVVHDEVVMEVDEGMVDEAKRILEQAMKDGYLDVFPDGDLTGLVDANSGDDWKEAK